MAKKIILDLATTLSITTNIVLVDNFVEIKNAMEELLTIKLTDKDIQGNKTIVANYILENYPELEGLQVNTKAIDVWLETQKQIFGDIFIFAPISTKKRKIKTR